MYVHILHTCIPFIIYIEPSQPREVNVHKNKVTEDSITLSWKKPNPLDMSIVGYGIEYRKGDECFKKLKIPLTYKDFTCKVTGLAANTEYEFRVAAINETGYGAFSDIVAQFTSESFTFTCTYIHTYVTVFWKTNLMVTNIEIHFLPVDKSHTYALSRDVMHLRLDGQACFYRRLFCNAVKPRGCISWPVLSLRDINKTAWGAKLILTVDLAYLVSSAGLG